MTQYWNDLTLPWQDDNLRWKDPNMPWNDPAHPWKGSEVATGNVLKRDGSSKIFLRDGSSILNREF